MNTNTLTWGDPVWLHGLWGLLVVALLCWAMHRGRSRRLQRIVPEGLSTELTPQRRSGNSALRTTLRLCACAWIVVALARPQLGFTWEEVQRQGLDLMVVFDTSNSMRATDLKPSRMEAARLALLDLSRNMNGDRLGLVAFAGAGFLQCPLTSDYGAFRLTVKDLYPGIIPRGGTSIGQALALAAQSFDEEGGGDKVILLITDGEAHEEDLKDVLPELKQRGIRVMVAGAGSLEGELIPVTVGQGREQRSEFLKDRDGRTVKTALREETLTQIAVETGGLYVRALQRDFGLNRILQEGIAPLKRDNQETERTKRHHERFQWPLAIAGILVFLEAMIHRPRKQVRT